MGKKHNKWTYYKTPEPKEVSNTWTTGEPTPIVVELAHGDKDKACGGCVYFKENVAKVVRSLTAKVKEEFQLYLIGKKVAKDDIVVEDYYIPKQIITPASVEHRDIIDAHVVRDMKIVALLHSHGTMQTFFSPTDFKTIAASCVEYHIITNNKGEFTGKRRWLIPGGNYLALAIDIMTLEPEVEIVGMERIEHRPATTTIVKSYTYDRSKDIRSARVVPNYSEKKNANKAPHISFDGQSFNEVDILDRLVIRHVGILPKSKLITGFDNRDYDNHQSLIDY